MNNATADNSTIANTVSDTSSSSTSNALFDFSAAIQQYFQHKPSSFQAIFNAKNNASNSTTTGTSERKHIFSDTNNSSSNDIGTGYRSNLGLFHPWDEPLEYNYNNTDNANNGNADTSTSTSSNNQQQPLVVAPYVLNYYSY